MAADQVESNRRSGKESNREETCRCFYGTTTRKRDSPECEKTQESLRRLEDDMESVLPRRTEAGMRDPVVEVSQDSGGE